MRKDRYNVLRTKRTFEGMEAQFFNGSFLAEVTFIDNSQFLVSWCWNKAEANFKVSFVI